MRKAVAAFFCVLFIPVSGAWAVTCLNTNDIRSSDSPDGKVLALTLKSGQVWNGELKGTCPDIRMNGFIWRVDGGQVCENAQSIRVMRSGQVCTLGKLSRQTPAKAVR